jgi:ribosomal protein S14
MNIFAFKKYKIKNLIKKELKKNLIKYFLSNQYKNFKSNKIIKLIYRNKIYYKYSSISFFRRSCVLSGNCKSVSRFFKLSRYLCRYYASNGFIVGLRKASF